jgi:hypothetical protein
MKEKVTKSIIRSLCDDFANSILVGLEENPQDFPFTISSINFIYELKEQGIYFNLKQLSSCYEILDNMYDELAKYLAR